MGLKVLSYSKQVVESMYNAEIIGRTVEKATKENLWLDSECWFTSEVVDAVRSIAFQGYA